VEGSDRLAIVGAGAMGSIFGAALAEAGVDVTLLDVSRPLVDRINEAGIRVVRDGVERSVSVPATDDPRAIGRVGAAIVFVKCYQTEAAAELMRPLVADESVVASLQNGWGNEAILARAFGGHRVAAGVTYHSGTTLAPGRVSHNAPGPTFIGPYEGDSLDGCRPLERALRSAGLEVTATSDVRLEVWKKLVFNAAGLAAGALTGLDPLATGRLREMRDLVFALAREAVDVARAAGYEIDADERVAAIAGALDRAAPGTKGSMRQDIEAGRPTEIDVINGAIAREAEAHGHEAPLSRAMVALVKGYESAHRQNVAVIP
jgi:2-dehydropantoate 2-reductase